MIHCGSRAALRLITARGFFSRMLFRKRKKRENRKIIGGKTLAALGLCALAAFVFAGAVASYYIYPFIKEAPDFAPEDLQPSLASIIVDKDSCKITDIHGEQKRMEIFLEELPGYVPEAFVAIEDQRFYEHIGVDPYAIARAAWVNLRERDWHKQGGSTITQQLARNAILGSEQTLRRKVQEAWLALQIERYYAKEEILAKYLNYIYFGEGAYGIEAAARTYFDREASELSLPEAAFLAGIIRSPTRYDIFDDPEPALQRQQVVLAEMHRAGFISAGDMEEARSAEIELADKSGRDEYPYTYYLDYVIHHELVEILAAETEYGSREEAYEAIYTDGLQVQVAMDSDMQQAVEAELERGDIYPETLRVDLQALGEMEIGSLGGYPEEVLCDDGVPQPQSAAVVADPETGALLALAGGRGYGSDNRSLRFLSPRQPGSAIKPILGYVPAIEEGEAVPATVIDDAPFALDSWTPENYDRVFRGLTTVREALVDSRNVPAVKTFQRIGPETGLDYGRNMGLSSIRSDDTTLAAVLGGMSAGVTPLEMAQAYAVLANNGIKKELYAVEKVENRDGELLYEHRAEPEAVISPETAYMINDILEYVVSRGTGRNIQAAGSLAAKTGTTSDNRDAWLVAYTPHFVISFWLGHDIQRLGKIPGGSGATVPFMNAIISSLDSQISYTEFVKPTGELETVSVCSRSGLRPGEDCPSEDLVEEIFPPGDIPVEECDLHIELEVCTIGEALAGEHCPADGVEEKTFLDRPEYEVTDERWWYGAGRHPEDAGLLPPEEECAAHTKPPPLPEVEMTLFYDAGLQAMVVEWEVFEAGLEKEEIQNYRLLRKEAGEDDFGLVREFHRSETEYLDEGLQHGETYIYRLEVAGKPDGRLLAEKEIPVSLLEPGE